MAIVAGIDEAGLGPVLGPLVVSAAVFRTPDGMPGGSMWSALAGAVCRSPARRGGKVVIADSKKLFTRGKPNALAHLERGVLGMLAAKTAPPKSLGDLLAAIAPGSAELMAQYPWYAAGPVSLPTCVTAADLILAGNSLRSAMTDAGIDLVAIRAEPVFVGQFNRHVTATNNKATALFDVTSRLLDWLWRTGPAEPLRVHVDRQGGRMRYLPGLQRIFPGCQFKVIDETDTFSAYRITRPGREAEICFLTKGEQHRLPVALASMTSKYLRELFMQMFNDFWIAHVPDLKATAGYYTDGRRFYREIAPTVQRLGFDERLLYRCR